MRAFWIHYTSILDGGAPTFSVMEATEDGRDRFISPPGRVTSAADVVELLVARGADRESAEEKVAAAMRQSIAHLLVI